MKVTQVNNDILKEPTNIVCHQVNCMGVMGAGLALQIKKQYPFVYNEYKNLCELYKNTRLSSLLLGKAQVVDLVHNISMYNTMTEFYYDNSFSICNLFGQFGFGTDKVQTDYNSLSDSIMNLCFLISDFSQSKQLKVVTISVPYGMGCGLAGGDWKKVEPLIINTFKKAEEKYSLDINLKIVKKEY